jgi:hypothetical protein
LFWDERQGGCLSGYPLFDNDKLRMEKEKCKRRMTDKKVMNIEH